MTLLAPLGGLFVSLAADPMFATDANGDSGARTLAGTAFVLLILAIVISIGLWMGRGERA
jgi:hypothetical protein